MASGWAPPPPRLLQHQFVAAGHQAPAAQEGTDAYDRRNRQREFPGRSSRCHGPRSRTTAGKSRPRSCSGPSAATWRTVCPTTGALVMDNCVFLFAMKRWLGLAVCWDGPDVHGHAHIATRGAGMSARHTVMIAAWRQIFIEAGGKMPDHNRERYYNIPTFRFHLQTHDD